MFRCRLGFQRPKPSTQVHGIIGFSVVTHPADSTTLQLTCSADRHTIIRVHCGPASVCSVRTCEHMESARNSKYRWLSGQAVSARKGTLELTPLSTACPASLIIWNCPQLPWEMERGTPGAWLVPSCAVDLGGKDNSFLPNLNLSLSLCCHSSVPSSWVSPSVSPSSGTLPRPDHNLYLLHLWHPALFSP